MKRAITTLTAALIFTGAFGSAAMAQYPAPNAGITRGEVSRFDRGYLDEHPEVARQLASRSEAGGQSAVSREPSGARQLPRGASGSSHRAAAVIRIAS